MPQATVAVPPQLTQQRVVIPSVTPKQMILALSFVVTQALAFGILDSGTAQVIVALGGIVIPAAFALADALHKGLVHAAVVKAAPAGSQIVLKP